MNVSEVQFKAPPASLSPQRVLWMKSALLVGCVMSAGILWEPKALWETVLILGGWTRSWHLRWPGWTMRGTIMWNLEVWNQNVTLNITTCTTQYLYYHCSIVLLWCCLFKMLPIGNRQVVPLSSLYSPGVGTPAGFWGNGEGEGKAGNSFLCSVWVAYFGTWKTSVPLLGWVPGYCPS